MFSDTSATYPWPSVNVKELVNEVVQEADANANAGVSDEQVPYNIPPTTKPTSILTNHNPYHHDSAQDLAVDADHEDETPPPDRELEQDHRIEDLPVQHAPIPINGGQGTSCVPQNVRSASGISDGSENHVQKDEGKEVRAMTERSTLQDVEELQTTMLTTAARSREEEQQIIPLKPQQERDHPIDRQPVKHMAGQQDFSDEQEKINHSQPVDASSNEQLQLEQHALVEKRKGDSPVGQSTVGHHPPSPHSQAPKQVRHVHFAPNTESPKPSRASRIQKRPIIPELGSKSAPPPPQTSPPRQELYRPRPGSRSPQVQPVRRDQITQDHRRTAQSPYQQPPPIQTLYDVLVIGGGVVGLATLRAATLAGYKAVLVEAEPDLLSGASSGNSGIACTGVDADPGSLERALIRDSISQIRPFLKKHRIPFRDCGSLVCQWEWDKVGRSKKYTSPLSKVLAESVDAGDIHARKLDRLEVGNLEPNVSPLCVGAVHIPGEIVLDPWLFSIAFAAHARENGAKIYTNFAYDPQASNWDPRRRIWSVRRMMTKKDQKLAVPPPVLLHARAIVNATGIVADLVQGGTQDANPPHWRAAPRRGQYRMFLPDQNSYILRPIQPVPTQRTKGVFVYSSLYDHIVVGPTAEEQEDRFDRKVNPSVADDLTSHALRILPDLDPQKVIGQYVGIRPATNHRDYQIHLTARCNWIAAAGIRSTGLTASLGIGRHIAHLLQSTLPIPTPLTSIRCTPLPEMRDLVEQFHSHPDGNVVIHGFSYRVTHPITRLGLGMQTGIANIRP